MLRRLHSEQPEGFAFTPENQKWAEAQITKYPEGRQASAIIPLLWRAQEQEGWLTRAAIEHVAQMLDMAYIRALEVATFYFMFQLQPVGTVAHIQICGTTSCMICGAEDLVAVCRDKIAKRPHQVSADGKFSWEEVECLGACANAPMAQIGKDYYEDLTAESFARLLDDMAAGKVPTPGPQNGRFASEPLGGVTTLADFTGEDQNASVALADRLGDTLKRIDGTEVPVTTPWLGVAEIKPVDAATIKAHEPKPAMVTPVDDTGVSRQEACDKNIAKPEAVAKGAEDAGHGTRPEMLKKAKGKADDLKKIKGVGPKLEKLLNALGVHHYWQIAGWSDEEVAWVDDNLEGFRGRVSRDDWVTQAKALAGDGKADKTGRK